MQEQNKDQYKQFVDIVIDRYRAISKGESAEQRIQESFLVFIHEKSSLLIVSDHKVFMQAVIRRGKPVNNQQKVLKPFTHGCRSDHYNFSVKQAKYYNFLDQKNPQMSKITQEKEKEKSPYYPQFHFNIRLQNFCKEREKLTYTPIQIIKVKEYTLKIVNIANTGYYAPLLQIYDYDKMPNIQLKETKFTLMSNILYDPVVEHLMNNLRLNDMRRQLIKNPATSNESQISMFYYMKNIKIQGKKSQLSEFICSDKTGKFLKTNTKVPQIYISLGNLSGVYRFIRPIASGINESFKLTLDVKALAALQENRRLQEKANQNAQQELDKNSQSGSSLWSEDEEYDQTTYNKYHYQENNSDYQSGSSDCEEPLKLMYLEQLKNMRIV